MLSVMTAAARLGLSFRRCYTVVSRGNVPAVKVPKGFLVAEADLPALAAAVATLPTRSPNGTRKAA